MNQPLRLRKGRLPDYPTIGEFLNPRWFVGFVRAFVGGWFVSRNYWSFLLGIPAVAVTCAGALATMRLAEKPGDRLAVAYERAAVKAGRVGSDAEADLMWKRLMQLKSEDKRYQLALATRLVEQEKYDEARRHLDALTGEDGFTPARLWLVDHARGESPVFKLTPEQQAEQLQAAVKESPEDAEAHRLLAQLYVERNDLRVAEKHLLQSVNRHATLGLPLFELQKRLGRDNEAEAFAYLRKAAMALEELVLAEPDDVENRIHWAQALIYLGEETEAEAILTESLQTIESAELRRAAAALMIGQARQLLSQSGLNTTPAAQYLKRAVNVYPEHPQVIPMVIALGARGGNFSSEDLAPLVSHVEALGESDDNDATASGRRLTLARLHMLTSEYDQAAAVLESDQTQSPEIQILLISIYEKQGRRDDVTRLTESVLKSLETAVEESPTDVAALARLLNAYLVAHQYQKALEKVERYTASAGIATRELPQLMKQRYVAACLAVYELEASHNVPEAFSFLHKAVESGFYTSQLIQLVAQRSLAGGDASEDAQALLSKMLADGIANTQIYSAIGTVALLMEQPEKAVRHLHLAQEQDPGNPVLKNNLALALIRSSENNFAEAMELCTAALERLPDHPDVLTTRAEISMARKRWQVARLDLEKALPRRPKSAKLRELLIEVYDGMGETALIEEHEKVLAELQDTDPGAGVADGATE